MPAFYRTNSNESIGGGARVLMSYPASAYPYPTRLSHIVDLATYAPNYATYGWVDVGSTKTPSRVSIGFSKTDWNNEQQGLYRSQINQWSGTATAEALEMRSHNKRMLMHATNPGGAGTGEVITNFPTLDSVPFVKLAFMLKDHLGLVHATILPHAQWDGAQIPHTFGRTDSQSIPMTWSLFGDDQFIDSVSGNPILRYDIDQET